MLPGQLLRPTVIKTILLSLLLAGNLVAENIGERYQTLNEEAVKNMFKDKERAMDLLAEAKKLLPGASGAYVNTGCILLLFPEDRTDEAQKEFQRALALCQTSGQFKNVVYMMELPSQSFYKKGCYELYEKGKTLIAENKCEEAVSVLREAVEINRKNSLTNYELGYAFVDIGEIDSALVYLERARKLNPAKYAVLQELALCYAHKADLDKLKQVVAEAEFLAGEKPHLKRDLARGYNKAGLHDMALAILEDSFVRFPDFYMSAFSLGRIYYKKKNDMQNAKFYMQRFIDGVKEQSSKNPGIKLTSGTMEEMISEARDVIRKAEAAGAGTP
jgi:tetratricopeptide (TPR) repeat protein